MKKFGLIGIYVAAATAVTCFAAGVTGVCPFLHRLLGL